MYDGIVSGQYVSKNYLDKNGLLESKSFLEVFRLWRDATLTPATASGCLTDGSSDTSNVYRVMSRNYTPEFVTASYTAAQTAKEIIAAPGAGKCIVVTYLAQRTAANTGESELASGTVTFGKCYWSPQTPMASEGIHIHCPANTAVTLTTTTSSAGYTVSIEYHIEEA